MKWLRFVLPAAALLVIVGFIAVSWLSRALPEDMSVESATIANGTIVMDNPVLTGQTEDERTFTVRARQATQAIGTPDVIRLSDIAASLPVNADESASVTAESGVYDRRAQRLTLDAPFHAESSSGLTVDMQSAMFDLDAREMRSDQPIEVRTGETSLVAQTVRMHDNGESIVFGGGVRMTIAPSTLRQTEEDGNSQ